MQWVMRGRGKLAQLPELAEKLGIAHPLLVAGRSGKGALLAALGKDAEGDVFSGFRPNPDFADCLAGRDMYLAGSYDGLISLGGGSAMDTAKGMQALLLASSVEDAMVSRLGDGHIPHIAIPSTAGTGSEATQFSVLYVDDVKRSISHPALLPDGVILDADLLRTLSMDQRKATAMDALCQGIESYWAKGATEESRVQAYLAITGAMQNLKPYLDGDEKAAEEMLEAAFRSGCAIQMTRTTAAHAMSYQLTKQYGLAHGHACMVTLPHLWAHMMGDAPYQPVLREIAAAMGLGSELMVPRFLSGLLLAMALPLPREVDDASLSQLADTVNLERLSNHPQPLNRDDILRIYRQSLTPLSGAAKQVAQDLWTYYGK